MNDELGQEFEAIRAMMKITSELDTDAAKRATQYVTQMLWERENIERLRELQIPSSVNVPKNMEALSGLDY